MCLLYAKKRNGGKYGNDMKYKVEFFQDNIYQVMEAGWAGENWVSSFPHPPRTVPDDNPVLIWSKVFQGTLPECEAWINLHEKGYM
jgi:hypothetical protein